MTETRNRVVIAACCAGLMFAADLSVFLVLVLNVVGAKIVMVVVAEVVIEDSVGGVTLH